MRMGALIAALMLAQGLAGCGGSGSSPAPSAPSSVAQVVPPPPNPIPPLDPVPQGYVVDSAFAALAGATVEIVDGPQAGTTMTSDATGLFPLTGAFVSTNTFRASKEGYVTATQGFQTSIPGGRPWLIFYLKPLAAPVNIAGDYALTFVADSACADLPSDVRTRTYAATIAPGSYPGSPADTSFELTVSGAPVLEKFRGFTIGVAGDSLGFWLHGGHDPPLVEQLAADTYLAYSGWATTRVPTSSVSTISTPFDGWIEYCRMNSPMGAYYGCGATNGNGVPVPGAQIAFAHCESKNHRLILTRR